MSVARPRNAIGRAMRHAIAGRVPTYECIGVLYLLQVELAGRRHEGGSTRNDGLPPTGWD
jgi:hypothetical protein